MRVGVWCSAFASAVEIGAHSRAHVAMTVKGRAGQEDHDIMAAGSWWVDEEQ